MISLSVFLIALALLSVSRQKIFMENYSQEFNDTLNEAMNVRIELESIMESAVQISQTIVDKVEVKVSQTPETTAKTDTLVNPVDSKPVREELMIAQIINMIPDTIKEEHKESADSRRTRVYELARNLQISSKALIKLLKSLGINVTSHMNALDDVQIRLVKQAVDSGLSTEIDNVIRGTIPINKEYSKEFEINEGAADQASDNENRINSDNLTNGSTSTRKVQQPEEQPLQGLGFSIEELKAAHPYIAVKTMYENGYPIREIAKLLGRGQGEVSLILNLSKKKPAVM